MRRISLEIRRQHQQHQLQPGGSSIISISISSDPQQQQQQQQLQPDRSSDHQHEHQLQPAAAAAAAAAIERDIIITSVLSILWAVRHLSVQRQSCSASSCRSLPSSCLAYIHCALPCLPWPRILSSRLVLSYLNFTCLALSCLASACLALLCLVFSYFVLLCFASSSLVLSCHFSDSWNIHRRNSKRIQVDKLVPLPEAVCSRWTSRRYPKKPRPVKGPCVIQLYIILAHDDFHSSTG